MKRKIFIIAFIGMIGLLVGVFYSQTMQLDHALEENVLSELVLNDKADGTYRGIYESNLVSAEVEVTIVNHRITEIVMIRHDTMFGKDAEVMVEEVMEHQSLDVDDVAGATYSSKVIKRAIEDALST